MPVASPTCDNHEFLDSDRYLPENEIVVPPSSWEPFIYTKILSFFFFENYNPEFEVILELNKKQPSTGFCRNVLFSEDIL